MTKKSRSNRSSLSTRGFTLLEVLIAVLIVGIIATAALPLLGSYTEQAREAQLIANARQLERSVERYEMEHKAPWGFVYEPLSEDLYIPYNWEAGLGFVEQLERPTDVYGNVLGDPGGSVVGPAVYGPYLTRAFVPASALLGVMSEDPSGQSWPPDLTDDGLVYIMGAPTKVGDGCMVAAMSKVKEGGLDLGKGRFEPIVRLESVQLGRRPKTAVVLWGAPYATNVARILEEPGRWAARAKRGEVIASFGPKLDSLSRKAPRQITVEDVDLIRAHLQTIKVVVHQADGEKERGERVGYLLDVHRTLSEKSPELRFAIGGTLKDLDPEERKLVVLELVRRNLGMLAGGVSPGNAEGGEAEAAALVEDVFGDDSGAKFRVQIDILQAEWRGRSIATDKDKAEYAQGYANVFAKIVPELKGDGLGAIARVIVGEFAEEKPEWRLARYGAVAPMDAALHWVHLLSGRDEVDAVLGRVRTAVMSGVEVQAQKELESLRSQLIDNPQVASALDYLGRARASEADIDGLILHYRDLLVDSRVQKIVTDAKIVLGKPSANSDILIGKLLGHPDRAVTLHELAPAAAGKKVVRPTVGFFGPGADQGIPDEVIECMSFKSHFVPTATLEEAKHRRNMIRNGAQGITTSGEGDVFISGSLNGR